MRIQTGFTLVELLISIFISVLLTLGVLGSTKELRNTYNANRDTWEVEDSVYFGMDMMIREIREGSGVTVNITQTTFQFNNQAGQIITYRLESNQLQRQVGNGSFVMVADNIDTATSQFMIPTGAPPDVYSITLRGLLNGREVRLVNLVALRN